MTRNRWAWALLPVLLGTAAGATAATKHLTCDTQSDDGVAGKVVAVLDDSSDKAEVQQYTLTAPCAATGTCSTEVFNKTVLPTVIRLSQTTLVGSITYQIVMDIDRSTLGIVVRSSLRAPNGQSDSTDQGVCEVRVDDAKKLL